jgi:hypothetical protein
MHNRLPQLGIQGSHPNRGAGGWTADETAVSIHESFALDDGALQVLVEKDFERLKPRAGESQANRFRNPKATG